MHTFRYIATESEVTEQKALGWHSRLALTNRAESEKEESVLIDVLTLADVRDYLIMRATHKQLGEVCILTSEL
jgi:hypothetical protein